MPISGKRRLREAKAAWMRSKMTAKQIKAFETGRGKLLAEMTAEEVEANEAFKRAERKWSAEQRAETKFIKKRINPATYVSSSPKEEDKN
jgi:hypothetical protein